jgi:aryl-alcohol dehydrogenase-like predicted oxidoreductase
MGMTAFYSAPPETEAESLRVFDKLIELGLNFIDTAHI